MSIYILNPGEPAPVYTHDGQYLGLWELKKTVSYTAMLDKNKDKSIKNTNQKNDWCFWHARRDSNP